MSEAQKNKPTHIAKQPRDKGPWPEIGVAWQTNNGGFNAYLHSLPLDGRIVFVPAEK